jgi:hypothetical protein
VWLYSRHYSGDTAPVGYAFEQANLYDDNKEVDYNRINKYWLSRIKVIDENIDIKGKLINVQLNYNQGCCMNNDYKYCNNQ